MKTNTKILDHFSRKTYLFGMFQQARVVYDVGSPQPEAQPAKTETMEKPETPGKTPDEKMAKLGKDADDLKADIEHLKANANPKIKELVANAEAKLAVLERKDQYNNLTENEKTATLNEVQDVIYEAEMRAVYEQQKGETKTLGEAAKKGVDSSLNNPLAGLKVSKEVGAAITDLAVDAAFKQRGIIERQLMSANALTLDSDKDGQKLQSIKNKLNGTDPGFEAELAKVYNDFVVQRDSVKLGAELASKPEMVAAKTKMGELRNRSVAAQEKLKSNNGDPVAKEAAILAYNEFKDWENYVKQLEAAAKVVKENPINSTPVGAPNGAPVEGAVAAAAPKSVPVEVAAASPAVPETGDQKVEDTTPIVIV